MHFDFLISLVESLWTAGFDMRISIHKINLIKIWKKVWMLFLGHPFKIKEFYKLNLTNGKLNHLIVKLEFAEMNFIFELMIAFDGERLCERFDKKISIRFKLTEIIWQFEFFNLKMVFLRKSNVMLKS